MRPRGHEIAVLCDLRGAARDSLAPSKARKRDKSNMKPPEVVQVVAIGLAFAVDYLDPSFRTPDEVREFLDVPVFASIPENGHEVAAETAVGTGRKNGH